VKRLSYYNVPRGSVPTIPITEKRAKIIGITGAAMYVIGALLRLTGNITVDQVTVLFGVAAVLSIYSVFVRWRTSKVQPGHG
jgi:hypothetical protein